MDCPGAGRFISSGVPDRLRGLWERRAEGWYALYEGTAVGISLLVSSFHTLKKELTSLGRRRKGLIFEVSKFQVALHLAIMYDFDPHTDV